MCASDYLCLTDSFSIFNWFFSVVWPNTFTHHFTDMDKPTSQTDIRDKFYSDAQIFFITKMAPYGWQPFGCLSEEVTDDVLFCCSFIFMCLLRCQWYFLNLSSQVEFKHKWPLLLEMEHSGCMCLTTHSRNGFIFLFIAQHGSKCCDVYML